MFAAAAAAEDSTNKYRKSSPGPAIVLGTMQTLESVFIQLRVEREINVVTGHRPLSLTSSGAPRVLQ